MLYFWKDRTFFELVKSYRLLPYFSWPHIPKSDPANTLRIMLVADPQLPGYWNQPSSIFGSISRHDSDSYLARTYSQALHYIKPDIIIFLGKYRGPEIKLIDYLSQKMPVIIESGRRIWVRSKVDSPLKSGRSIWKWTILNQARRSYWTVHGPISLKVMTGPF